MLWLGCWALGLRAGRRRVPGSPDVARLGSAQLVSFPRWRHCHVCNARLHARTRPAATQGWRTSVGCRGTGAMWGGRLGAMGAQPGRQQSRVRLLAHSAIPAVTKHRPCAGVAGDVPVSCLAPAVGGRGGPSPARGLPATAITQRRWPWGGLRAVSICSWRGAAPRREGARGPSSPRLRGSTCVNCVRPRRRAGWPPARAACLGAGRREGLAPRGGSAGCRAVLGAAVGSCPTSLQHGVVGPHGGPIGLAMCSPACAVLAPTRAAVLRGCGLAMGHRWSRRGVGAGG